MPLGWPRADRRPTERRPGGSVARGGGRVVLGDERRLRQGGVRARRRAGPPGRGQGDGRAARPGPAAGLAAAGAAARAEFRPAGAVRLRRLRRRRQLRLLRRHRPPARRGGDLAAVHRRGAGLAGARPAPAGRPARRRPAGGRRRGPGPGGGRPRHGRGGAAGFALQLSLRLIWYRPGIGDPRVRITREEPARPHERRERTVSDQDNVSGAAMLRQPPDADPEETGEWLDSLDAVVEREGPERAAYLLGRVLRRAGELRVGLPGLPSTAYVNTIPADAEPDYPGDEELERKLVNIVRWNAAAIVSRANRPELGLGGHMASYASAAELYETGFNHFFRGKDGDHPGDQIFFQGHSSPGIYARAFLEGRLSSEQLDLFRQENPPGGLPSYPHPRLMPEFWEFPTVSMGLGAINAIYQARFNKYLANQGIADTSGSRVW